MKKKIAVILGDGIGPEVTEQSIKVLNIIAKQFKHEFSYEHALMGAIAIDKTGNPLPDETIKICLASDAILFGAIGDPKYDNDPSAPVRPEQGLLKMLEGTEALVPPQGGRKHPEQKMIKVDTKNILFICGGAFDGIDKVIARRINTNAIGFSVNKDEQENARKNLLQFINAQDLKSFGLIPELLGRLPVVTHLEPLDAGILRSILTEPKNSLLKQYHRLFELEGIELIIEEEVFDFMVGKAMEYKLGARGLRSLCEAILTDAMYDLPSSNEKTLHIDKEYTEDALGKNLLKRLEIAS